MTFDPDDFFGVAIVDLLTALDYSHAGIEWRLFSPSLNFDIVVMQANNKSQGKLAGLLNEALLFGAARTSHTMADVVSNADK